MDKSQKRRKGGGGVHGIDYQLDVVLLFFLKAYESGRDFQISSEILKDGKFDDVVLTDGVNIIMSQTKHNEKEDDTIHLEALLNETHKYSLLAHYRSFKINSQRKLENLNRRIQAIPGDDRLIHELKNISTDVIQSFNSCSREYEQLLEELIIKIDQTEDAELSNKIAWFKRCSLIFITNIGPHYRVKNEILIENKFEKNDFLYSRDGDSYYIFQPEKTFNVLTESLDPARSTFDNEEVLFKHFLKKLKLMTLKNDKLTINILISLGKLDIFRRSRKDLELVHNYFQQKIKKWYLTYADENILNRMYLEVMFSDLCTEVFVKELGQYQNKFHFKIDNLLKTIEEKKITLINTPRHLLLMVKMQQKWLKQIKEGKMLFVNPNEHFQLQICLTTSFKNPKYTHYICPLLNQNHNELLSNIILIMSDLKDRNYKKFIILTNISSVFSHFSDISAVTDEKCFINMTLKGIERLKSLGDMKNFYVPRRLRHKYDNLSEERLLKKHIKSEEKFVLIIDGPGMGKTTLLTSLTCKINQKNRLWAIYINLNQYTNLLNQCLKNKKIELSDFLSGMKDDDIKMQILTIPKIIILMIDSVDEVSPKYTNIVLDFLQNTSNKVAKVFVTSREHLKKQLSESLNVIPFTLENFEEKHQKKFILSFWVCNLKIKNEDKIKQCENFCNQLMDHLYSSLTKRRLNVLGIPLQTRMVAEIFLNGNKSEFPGCKQFLEDKECNINLPNNFSLCKLYDLFVDRKKEIYIEEKGNSQGNVITETDLAEKFNDYLNVCHNLAVKTIFNKKHWNTFDIVKDSAYMDIYDEHLYKIGLLILPADKWWLQIDDSSSEDSDASAKDAFPQFIHRTFAEYFASKVTWKKLLNFKPEKDISLPNFMINEIFLKSRCFLIQLFMEYYLKNNWNEINPKLLGIFSELLHQITINEEKNLNLLARRDCFHILKLLLDASESPYKWINETFGEEKENLLHESMEYLHIVKLLVKHGADVNLKGIFNKTALHYAAENGYMEVVQYLVDEVENIDSQTESGLTPLHEALFNQQYNIVEFLITQGASVEIRTGGGWSSLHYAALTGSKFIVEMILGRGVQVDEKTTNNFSGRTALHIAFKSQHFDICEYLIERGSDVNITDDIGWGLWSFAVTSDEKHILKACKFLVDNTNNYNIEKDSEALTIVINNGDLDILHYLINSGFNINLQNRKQWTPLQEAIKRGRFDICKLLLEHDADVTVRVEVGLFDENENDLFDLTEDDFNVLHLAARHAELISFQILENKFPYINCKTSKQGFTTLHLAATNGELELVQYLCQTSDPCICLEKTSDGKNALHYAACGDLDVVEFLVNKFGFEFDTMDNKGNTVLHIAVAQGRIEILIYIINKLKSKHVNLNFTSGNGSLILYKPNKKYVEEITKILLEAGVSNDAIKIQENIGDQDATVSNVPEPSSFFMKYCIRLKEVIWSHFVKFTLTLSLLLVLAILLYFL